MAQEKQEITRNEYPYVSCIAHPGQTEPGYAICDHIETKEDIGYFVRASPQQIGILSCAKCAEEGNKGNLPLEELTLCCAQHLRDSGLLGGDC